MSTCKTVFGGADIGASIAVGGPPTGGGAIGAPAERVLEDLLDERLVGDPHLGRGLREIVLARQGWIGVRLDHDDLAVGGEAHVDAAEPADVEDPVDASGEVSELLVESRCERPGRAVADLPLLAIGLVPLGLGRREARRVVVPHARAKREFGGRTDRRRWRVAPIGAGDRRAEEDLARWKDREALVAEDAEVELAPVHVLLDERVALEALVQVPRAFDGLRLVLREGRARDPLARLFAHGLDERRVREPTQPPQRPLARRYDEARDADPVEGEELLGDRLVL